MWPFRSQPDGAALRDLKERMDEFEQRFKVLEREHDDLHASYRRLRGARAVEARDAPKDTPKDRPGAPEPESRPYSKAELRRKYLVVGIRKLGGNGELPNEDS